VALNNTQEEADAKIKAAKDAANRGGAAAAAPTGAPAEDPRITAMRAAREADWQTGLKRGQELFPAESLGRLGTNSDIQRVMEARRQQAGGISPQEQNLMRAQMMGQIGSANQGALRQLRGVQGASGIQGAAAGAQAADVLRSGQQAMLGAERDIQMQNLLQKRAGINELEQSATGLGKFDIGQANKEKMGGIYAGLGEQMLGVSERTGLQSADIAKQQAQVSSGGGKK